MAHPNTRGRTPPARPEITRAMVYAPAPERAKWIDEELAEDNITVQVGRTVEVIVTALIHDPPPRAQLLIADVDAMTPGELLHLHKVREQGWFGAFIALGSLPIGLRKSLAVDRVLSPPFARNVLRYAVADVGIIGMTTRV